MRYKGGPIPFPTNSRAKTNLDTEYCVPGQVLIREDRAHHWFTVILLRLLFEALASTGSGLFSFYHTVGPNANVGDMITEGVAVEFGA